MTIDGDTISATMRTYDDDDGDGWSDVPKKTVLDTDSKDSMRDPSLLTPLRSSFPGTSVGLGAWDLNGNVRGNPSCSLWLAFGFVTRNSRSSEIRTSTQRKQEREMSWRKIALDWEYAMMMRLDRPTSGHAPGTDTCGIG
ncbi:MAG: hypothetical protein ACJZ59_04560 [Candidatus Thalassarchaeaceae archaeon]